MSSRLDASLVEIRVRVPVSMATAMLRESRYIPGCKRHDIGSVAHYLREAARERLAASGYTENRGKEGRSDWLDW